MNRPHGAPRAASFLLVAVGVAACAAVPRSGALQFVAGRYERVFGLTSEQRLAIDSRGRFQLEEREAGRLEQVVVGEVYPVSDKLGVEIEGPSASSAEESPIARPRALHLLLARGDVWLVPEGGVRDFERFRDGGDAEALRRSGAFRRVE
ncbi:MAG TPA: hypothetical protein VKE69_09985 [Planctomycetota bacterium]|nr:hypothetical protein [Planctomycetota bacterium]